MNYWVSRAVFFLSFSMVMSGCATNDSSEIMALQKSLEETKATIAAVEKKADEASYTAYDAKETAEWAVRKADKALSKVE